MSHKHMRAHVRKLGTYAPVPNTRRPHPCTFSRRHSTYLLVDGGRSSLGHRFSSVFAEHLVFAKHCALCFRGVM